MEREEEGRGKGRGVKGGGPKGWEQRLMMGSAESEAGAGTEYV